MSDWIILRCAGRSTLPLADSLNRAGIEAWTPRCVALGSQKLAPITPTYVFARSAYIFELIHLAANPGDHHGFSIMPRPDGYGCCVDKELNGFRDEEEAMRPKPAVNPKRRHKIAERYGAGETVRVPPGTAGFAGLDGKVEASDGRYTDLYFGGSIRLKIETFKLRGDGVSDADLIAA